MKEKTLDTALNHQIMQHCLQILASHQMFYALPKMVKKATIFKH
jgi:hypothetical protein